MRRADPLGKTLMLGKIEGRRRGWPRMRWLHGINGHEFEETRGDTKGQGSLASCSLQSMGSQRVGKDWETEQQLQFKSLKEGSWGAEVQETVQLWSCWHLWAGGGIFWGQKPDLRGGSSGRCWCLQQGKAVWSRFCELWENSKQNSRFNGCCEKELLLMEEVADQVPPVWLRSWVLSSSSRRMISP